MYIGLWAYTKSECVDVKVEKLKYEYFSRIRMSLKVLY